MEIKWIHTFIECQWRLQRRRGPQTTCSAGKIYRKPLGFFGIKPAVFPTNFLRILKMTQQLWGLGRIWKFWPIHFDSISILKSRDQSMSAEFLNIKMRCNSFKLNRKAFTRELLTSHQVLAARSKPGTLVKIKIRGKWWSIDVNRCSSP